MMLRWISLEPAKIDTLRVLKYSCATPLACSGPTGSKVVAVDRRGGIERGCIVTDDFEREFGHRLLQFRSARLQQRRFRPDVLARGQRAENAQLRELHREHLYFDRRRRAHLNAAFADDRRAVAVGFGRRHRADLTKRRP